MDLLEHNQLNRPLRDRHVRRIAAQILEDKWRYNGDTIKVAETGDVLDGQHRLWAVIEAKKPITTIIVRGIERDAFATIDTIRQTRNGSDVLALSGAANYRTITASALSWLIRFQRGVAKFKDPINRVENSDLEMAYADHPGIVRAVEAATRLRGVCNPSILGFFYYVLTTKNAALAERMFETLRNPVSISSEDPFFRLRAYLVGEHGKRRDPLMTIALMIKAANAAHKKKTVKALVWRSQGDGAEGFPELEVD